MAELAERVRESCRLKNPKHWHRFKEWGGPGREFGLVNYPLPTQGAAARPPASRQAIADDDDGL